jgi:TPR repeat protein
MCVSHERPGVPKSSPKKGNGSEERRTLLGDPADLKRFLAAANAGDPAAQCNVGVLYLRGEGVPKDPVQAELWFRRGALQGNVNAQVNLAYLYATGPGVSKDPAEAAKWYRAAAEAGHLASQRHLGFLYYTGQGLPRDWEEAARWYSIAADRGHALAQFDLAVMHWRGKGIRRNRSKAIALAFRAASDPDAYRRISELPTPLMPLLITVVTLGLLCGFFWWKR